MSHWSPQEIEQFKEKVKQKLVQLEERILEYRELTKPIPPENAIGRVSRMDAINNRSVNEAALRQVEKQHQDLLRALDRLKEDRFGLCHHCGDAIPMGRILLVPGATSCVSCAD